MNDNMSQPRVPAGQVLGSIAALWACYFLVATLRGAFLGLDFVWPIISRRLTICIVSMLIMAALWPLLQLLDRRSFAVRVIVVLVGALPVSLLLGYVNDIVFADINEAAIVHKAAMGNVRVSRDEAGNILVDLPPPTPPAPPPPPPSPPGSTNSARSEAAPAPVAPGVPNTPDIVKHGPDGAVTITGEDGGLARWAAIADTAFGRYFLVIAWATLYFAMAKAEQAAEAERREGEYRRAAEAAELRSLRYQINPHFLFNTLNSLSALVMTGRHDDAEAMIQTLSTFYRHTLSGDPTNDMPLVDEIELQKLYLAIESVRFPDRLRTEIAVDADVADAMVPGMILQPLVENSVKYAVAATPAPVTISIEARRDGNELVIAVSDNGPGTAVAGVVSSGIGLANVRDRLRARFGDAASLSYGKPADGGFRTIVRVPLEHGRG